MGIKMLRLPGPGKNLCKVNNDTISANYTVKTEGQTLRITGTGSSQWLIPSITHDAVADSLSNAKTISSGIKKFDAGQTYTVQIFGAVATITDLQLVSVDKANNASITLTNGKATFTPDWDVCDIYIRYNGATTITFNESITVQIEKGSTATAYEPYQDHIYYPGVTNENDGTRGKVDLGTLTWIYQTDGTYPVFRATVSSPSIATGKAPIYTDIYEVVRDVLTATAMKSTNYEKCIGYQSSSNVNHIMVQDSRYTSIADFKAAMSGKYLYYKRNTDTGWTKPFWAFLIGGNS